MKPDTLALVAAAEASKSALPPVTAPTPAAPGSALVEYKKPDLLREEEEDLEIKLRRIIENVPVRVSNTSGSSAGSGSGDFHQYRQMRRKEQDRLARMDADYQKRKELLEFNARREERRKAADDRTAKKRLKRQKKKQRKKGRKVKVAQGEEDDDNNNHKEEPSSEEDSGDDSESQRC